MSRSPFWRDPFKSDSAPKRRHRTMAPEDATYFTSRLDAIIALRRDGGTLEEIAQVYKVSRERIRQVLAMAGITERPSTVDPIRTINVSRKAGSIGEAAKTLRTKERTVLRTLQMTGHWPAMERLWRIRRKHHYGKMSDELLIACLQELAEQIGGTPGMQRIDTVGWMPGHTTYVNHFGSMTRAQELAGLKPNKRGVPGHLDKERSRSRRPRLSA